jgi:hypothetical protein
MRTALCLTLALAFACGSSDKGAQGDTTSGLMMKADGTCSHVSACGGDVTGMWSLSEACYGVPAQNPTAACPGRMSSVKVDHVAGMYDFVKDGSYSGDLSITAHVVVLFPPSCLVQGGMTLRCTDLSGQTDDGSMLTCATATGGACSCTLPLSVNIDDMGSYTARGSKLDKGGETVDYCVQGNRLYMEPEMDMSMGMSSMPMMDDLEVTFQIGFKKQ